MATEDIRERLAQLPHHAVVAFAARCARRVQPLTHVLPQQGRDAIDRAIASAEAFAKGCRRRQGRRRAGPPPPGPPPGPPPPGPPPPPRPPTPPGPTPMRLGRRRRRRQGRAAWAAAAGRRRRLAPGRRRRPGRRQGRRCERPRSAHRFESRRARRPGGADRPVRGRAARTALAPGGAGVVHGGRDRDRHSPRGTIRRRRLTPLPCPAWKAPRSRRGGRTSGTTGVAARQGSPRRKGLNRRTGRCR